MLPIPGMGSAVGALLDGVIAWLSERALGILHALWELLSSALLVVPDVTVLPQVQAIAARSLMIVNTCFVLAIITAGVAIMGRGTVQSQYGIAELGPRLIIAFIAANMASPLCATLIEVANALTQALTGQGITPGDSLSQMRRSIVAALTNPTDALLTLIIGLIIAALVAMILLGWVIRLGLLVVLVGIAPIALACHATPWTDPAAKLWWRAFVGALATVVAQAFALHTALSVFLDPGANLAALGLPQDPTETFNLLLVVCLLWAVVKIPALMRRYVTGGHSTNVVATVMRVAVVQQVSRALTGGLWRGGRTGRGAPGVAGARASAGGASRVGSRLPHPPRSPRATPSAANASTEMSATQGVSPSRGAGGGSHAVPRVPSGRTPATAMPQRMPRWRRWWAYSDTGTGWPDTTRTPTTAAGPVSGAGWAGDTTRPAARATSPAARPADAQWRTASGTGWPSVPTYGPRTTRATAAARSAAAPGPARARRDTAGGSGRRDATE